MKKALYSLVLLFGFVSYLNAQCPVGDVVLSNQTEVNAYTFTSCTTINGNLYITDNPSSPTIVDLSKLSSIQIVTGSVQIKNLGTSSIPGLGSLSSIGGNLDIESNNSLTSLGSLSSLNSVDNLFVSGNSSLLNLSGLDHLSIVGGIFINNNTQMSSLDGLQGVTNITGSLDISGSNMLSISALSSLSDIGGSLSISSTKLTTLTGLESLTSLGGDLSVSNNSDLTSISSLSNLQEVADGNGLSIENNPNLPTCVITAVCGKISSDFDNISISGNKTGSSCEGLSNVQAACSAALPVELVFFKGKPLSGIVLITWQTASENNNDYFQIEHSTDGKYFNTLGNISGNGTSQEVHNYQFRHPSPIKGVNYYRLKQVDKSRKFEYSDIISIVLDRREISVFPNPTKGNLEIAGDVEEANIRVKDSMGKIVASQNLDAHNSINLSYLPKGMYFIEVRTANQTDIKRIIKE